MLFWFWLSVLALFLVCLVVFGVILARSDGWKVWLMVLVLALYSMTVLLVLVVNEMCNPSTPVSIAEVNANRLLVVLAVACVVTAVTLVRRHAYAYAFACLAVPPLLLIAIVAIIPLLIPGERGCNPFGIL